MPARDAELLPPPAAPEGSALSTVRAMDPDMARLMELALKGDKVDALEKLVALSERVQDRNAAREFGDAKARFQESCPPIKKTSKAKITSRKTGSSYEYDYAELDEIAQT